MLKEFPVYFNSNKPKKRQHWFFTFGDNHSCPNGYLKIYGTFQEAREEMELRCGDKWSVQYSTAEAAGVEKYNLHEIE